MYKCQMHGVSMFDHCPECRTEFSPIINGGNQCTPASILSEAESIINGPRREAYGPVEESFERLAAIYTNIIFKKLKEPLTAHDIALLGVGLKLCREANKAARDNRVDLCGYAALADKVAPKEGK